MQNTLQPNRLQIVALVSLVHLSLERVFLLYRYILQYLLCRIKYVIDLHSLQNPSICSAILEISFLPHFMQNLMSRIPFRSQRPWSSSHIVIPTTHGSPHVCVCIHIYIKFHTVFGCL